LVAIFFGMGPLSSYYIVLNLPLCYHHDKSIRKKVTSAKEMRQCGPLDQKAQ
jgi:hypothetical protein